MKSVAFIAADLDAAERNVAAAEQHVVAQERLRSWLLMQGYDTSLAEEVLMTFCESLRLHRRDREVIRSKLEAQERERLSDPVAAGKRRRRMAFS